MLASAREAGQFHGPAQQLLTPPRLDEPVSRSWLSTGPAAVPESESACGSHSRRTASFGSPQFGGWWTKQQLQRGICVRLTTTLRASVVLAALATGSFGGVDTATLALGITPAGANEFYTRKRVRGRWVTGHFTRRHSGTRRRNVEPEARPTADRGLQDDPVPTTLAPKTNLTSKQAIKPEPAPPARAAQVSDPRAASGVAAPLTRDERLLKLQDALHAHARNLASNSEPASGAPSSAAGLSSTRPGPAEPEPQAVLFDFQSGVKTTVFTDRSKVEEPFDTASMKGLASARSIRASGGNRP
jgi:hypothetical protein